MIFNQINKYCTLIIIELAYFILSSDTLALTNNISLDTITTSSDLKYIIISKGNGAKADTGMEVEVYYKWYLTNGRLIGSSSSGVPFDFVLGKGKVIKGWDEGISYMHAGGHYIFIIPPELGYGAKGAGDVIPPKATLIYDTYLVSVTKAKEQFIDTLYNLSLKESVDSAISLYHKLYQTEKDKYNFKEDQLNILGFKLLLKERRDEAFAIFKLNIEMYPQSARAYDSLGEAYLKYGLKSLALDAFEKALQIDPHNAAAESEILRMQSKR